MSADRYAVIAITWAVLQNVDAGAFRGYLAAKSRNFRIPDDRVAHRRRNPFDCPLGDLIAPASSISAAPAPPVAEG